MQEIVHARSFDVDLSPLRRSIRVLQAASLSLDYEKLVAERSLDRVIKKWKKTHSKLRKLKRKLDKIRCDLQRKLGHPCKKHRHDAEHITPRIGKVGAHIREQKEAEHEMFYGFALHSGIDRIRQCTKHGHWMSPDTLNGHPHLPKLPFAEFREAIKRIRTVNQKLVSIERGMISEEGIPEREWYRHLGVAPGKWLGMSRLLTYAMLKNDRLWSHDIACVDGVYYYRE